MRVEIQKFQVTIEALKKKELKVFIGKNFMMVFF